jgi:hypothetical protein
VGRGRGLGRQRRWLWRRPRRRGGARTGGLPQPDRLPRLNRPAGARRLGRHDARRLARGRALHLRDQAALQQDHLGDDERHAGDAGHECRRLRPQPGRRLPRRGGLRGGPRDGGAGFTDGERRDDQRNRDRSTPRGSGCVEHRRPFNFERVHSKPANRLASTAAPLAPALSLPARCGSINRLSALLFCDGENAWRRWKRSPGRRWSR